MKDFIKKFKNKKFLIAFVSLIIALLCALGFDIPKENVWEVFFILLSLGLITGLVKDDNKTDEDYVDEVVEDALKGDNKEKDIE